MTRLLRGIAAAAMALFWSTAASAVTPFLSVNNDPNGAVTVCGGTMTVFGMTGAALFGKYKYAWTLYRDGAVLTTNAQEIECKYPGPCPLPRFSIPVAASSGTYQLKLETKLRRVAVQTEYSNLIVVTVASDDTGC